MVPAVEEAEVSPAPAPDMAAMPRFLQLAFPVVVALSPLHAPAADPPPGSSAPTPAPRAEPPDHRAEKIARGKIKFPLDRIDAIGLRGPEDGKTAVDYEFCIAKSQELVDRVMKIDPSVEIQPGSRGRIGCNPETQILCTGNTHQKNWKKILLNLARLPEISEIRECVWE